MPNWTRTYLKIRRCDRDKVLDKNNKVDFGIIAPEPDGMAKERAHTIENVYDYISNHGTNSMDVIKANPAVCAVLPIHEYERVLLDPSQKDAILDKRLQIVKKDYEEIISNPNLMSFLSFDQGLRYVDCFLKHGAKTWYDWRLLNWGTKWQGSEVKVTNHKDNTVTVAFNTPWYAPDAWLAALAKHSIPFRAETDLYEDGIAEMRSCDGTNVNITHCNYVDKSDIKDIYGDEEVGKDIIICTSTRDLFKKLYAATHVEPLF